MDLPAKIAVAENVEIGLKETGSCFETLNDYASTSNDVEITNQDNSNKEVIVYQETDDPSVAVAVDNLIQCQGAIDVEMNVTSFLLETVWKKNSKLFAAEDSLLSLAASKIIPGIFFCCVLEIELGGCKYNVARYFEHGAFNGFYDFAKESIKSFVECEELLPYCSYTPKDVLYLEERNKKLSISKRKIGEKEKDYKAFARKIWDQKGSFHKNITSLLVDMNNSSVTCPYLIAFCLKKGQSWDTKFDAKGREKERYFVCHPADQFEKWEESLMTYRCNQNSSDTTSILWCNGNKNFSLETQFKILSCIPNFHKWSWDGEIIRETKFETKFSTAKRYYPASPRNKIIRAFRPINDIDDLNSTTDLIVAVLMNLRGIKTPVLHFKKAKKHSSEPKKDKKEQQNELQAPSNTTCDIEMESESFDESPESTEQPCIDVSPSDTENANLGNVEIPTTTQNDCELDKSSRIEDNLTYVENETLPLLHPQIPKKITLYEYFLRELFSEGEISWRVYKDDKQIVMMNSTSPDTGNLLAKEFVHVTVESCDDVVHFECTCTTFSIQLSTSEDRANFVNCCHCRLLREIFIKYIVEESYTLSSFVNENKISNGISHAQVPVLKLPSKYGVKKYSVVSTSSVAFVSIFQKKDRSIISCQSATCRMGEGSNRNITLLCTSKILCPHLEVFKEFYESTGGDTGPGDESDEDEETFDDIESRIPECEWEEIFDSENGLWSFHKNAPSKIPVDQDPFSEILLRNIGIRGDLKEFVPNLDGSCDCGAGWNSDEIPLGIIALSGKTKLYTVTKAIEYAVFKRKCLSNECVKMWDGAKESIFRSSASTCCGYEIGWEFVDSVMNAKQTFRGYVTIMNNRYRRFGSEDTFMSIQTFINWFFSWASAMNVDFRENGCKLCPGQPKILACDGTKIGIGFKNTYVNPIETPELDTVLQEQTRRFDRCFLANQTSDAAVKKCYRNAREELKYICSDIVSNGDSSNKTPSELLLRVLPTESLPAFQQMLNSSNELRKAYAKLFYLLSFDSSLDTVIPLRLTDLFLRTVDSGLTDRLTSANLKSFCQTLDLYTPEISHLLRISSLSNESLIASSDIFQLLRYCSLFVKGFHDKDVQPDAAIPIPNSYNPPKNGRAYYFHPHGCQLRKVRPFKIDNKKTENFDDVPESFCAKKFPQVAKKGVSYLFLWFCPQHGCCLGFHIVPGSEGRKDPAASLYTHLEVAPTEVFYDFACSLSEYTHNRESGYFRNTRFFHDVFHGYSHKCTSSFRCDRLKGFSSINSSICEQFNAFLQNIKTSAKLMSQSHFCFYVQFFISIWNKQKIATFTRRLNIAKSVDM